MRRKYKNEIFQLLLSSKYGIERFEIKEQQEINGLLSDIIYFNNSPLYFIIRNSNDDFEAFDYQYTRYAPEFPLSDIYPQQNYISFREIIERFNKWLFQCVDAYIEDKEEPDLWQELNMGNKTLNINNIDFDNKTLFSSEEKRQIGLSLNELKLLMHKKISTSKDEQEIINNRLDYLIDASKRLNRFDWKSLALSSLVSISIALSLDTQKGHLVFELFKKVFSVMPLLTK